MAKPASVQFEAKYDGLSRGTTEVVDLLDRGAKYWDRFGVSAKGAFENLEKGAKSYKRDQVQEGRLLGFYAREIQEFVPLSGQAANAMTGISQAAMALASGSILGAAFEVAKTVVGYIKEIAKDANDELDKLIQKSIEARSSAKENFVEQYMRENGEDALKAQADLTRQRQNYADGLRQMQANPQYNDSWKGAVDAQKQYLEDLEQKLAEARAQVRGLRTEAEALYDSAQKAKEIGFQQTSGTGGIKSEGALTGTAGVGASTAEFNAIAKAHQQAYDQMKADLAGYDKAVADSNAQVMKFAEAEGQGRQKALDEKKKADQEAFDGRVAWWNAELKRQDAALQQAAQQWQRYGEAVGSAMAGLATGTKSFSQVLASALQEVAAALYQWAIKAIMTNAGVAAANTEAQMSSQGPYGWLAGLGAMAVVFGAVQALIGKMGGAEAGAYLPDWGASGKVAMLHRSEMVTTAGDTAIWKEVRSIVKGGRAQGQAANGMSVALTVQAPPDQDPYAFTKHIQRNRPQFERSLAEALPAAMRIAGLR
jgi:hypothetical protein